MSDTAVSWRNRSWEYIFNGPEKTDAPTQEEHQNFINERNPNLAKRATPLQTFSLGGAIIFALGWLCSLKSDSSFIKWTTGILTAIGLGATALFKGWSKDGNDSILNSIKKFFSGETNEKSCKDRIFGIAAEYLAKHIEGNKEEIKNALLNPTSENSALLKDVFQIEYIATKKDSSKYDIEVSIRYIINGKEKRGSITFEESWDEVLPKVGEDFLRKGGDTHTCIMYERNPNNQKP